MRKSLFLFLLSGALLLPCAAFAQSVYSDTYVIPVVSHTQGLGGSLWMSDVAITNFSSTPLNVELVVVESGATNMDNIYPLTTATNDGAITVPANATVVLRDVLNGHRGMTNTYGALILGGDKPFAVTSRLYNGGTGGNMVGQTVTPARDFFENSTGQADNAAVAYLPGLVSNASARTNIGFVAGSGSNAGASMNVEVRIKNAAGQTLGTRNFSIASGNFTHVQ
ncbi:MAG TPA: hypothetical protein VFN10_20175, partial [Thermoanaerobaculia bacterium]|nr:hypothetical protein [Thermoanaerobaculia bacterium]